MQDFFSALCLVAVLEGLFLFAAPFAWKRLVERLLGMHSFQLRVFGAVTLAIGLLCLWAVRH
ncbi:MAG TPA: DUF2065 domain-containing protein [Xanthomonadaceae bacterium]|nr:DUF2065 domain-containing protein [Xanthomonadaceae bacterium]